MDSETFFKQQSEQSRIKAQIVSQYFYYWSKIISEQVLRSQKSNRIIYMDLFCGRGMYGHGEKSTPILVLENILRDSKLSSLVRCVFNDGDADNIAALKQSVDGLEGISKLNFPPKFYNEPVHDGKFQEWLRKRLPPTLLFADPWGYKGLSLNLFAQVLNNWGSEVIMFFNYQRINAALSNQVLLENMQLLFGETADKLFGQLTGLSPKAREQKIMRAIKESFQSRFKDALVLDFKFIDDQGTRTTHHIIHVSRHGLAFKGMKEVMHGHSTERSHNVATLFEHNPAKKNVLKFEFDEHPIEVLKRHLLKEFRDRTLSFKKMFHEHQIKTLSLEKDYQEAIRQLESEGKVETTPPSSKRKSVKSKVTVPETLTIKFN